MPGKRARPVRRGADGKELHLQYLASGLPNFCEDVGSRWVPYAAINANVHAETALAAVIRCLRRTGLMGTLTCDRDPRWVGSQSLERFSQCPAAVPAWRGEHAERVPAAAAR
jgi:hypothetical protein